VAFWNRKKEERQNLPLAFSDWFNMLYQGVGYPIGLFPQTMSGKEERIAQDYEGLVNGALRGPELAPRPPIGG